MKKILSLLLVICMFVTGCVVFTSCGTPSDGDGTTTGGSGNNPDNPNQQNALKAEDVTANPYAILTEVSQNAMSGFFTDEAGINSAIVESMKAGSIELSFSGETILADTGISKISETIYADAKNHQYVSDTLIEMLEDTDMEDLSLRLFLNKNNIAIGSDSEMWFGIKDTYKINIATLAEDFKNSVLAQMIGLDSATLNEISGILETVVGAYTSAWEFAPDADTLAEAEAEINALLGKLNLSAKLEGENIVVTYLMTNATIREFINKAIDDVELSAELIETLETLIGEELGEVADIKSSLKESVKNVLDEMDEEVVINFNGTYTINAKSRLLTSEGIKGQLSSKTDDEVISVNMKYVLSNTEISYAFDVTAEGEKIGADVKLTKTVKGDETVYALAMNVQEGENKVNPFNASASYNKKSGAFALSLDVLASEGEMAPEDSDVSVAAAGAVAEDERVALTLKGTAKAEDSKASISFTSVTAGDVTVNFNLSIVFNKKATVPQIPANAKDVMQMTEEEWGTLMENFSNSFIGSMLFAQSAPDESGDMLYGFDAFTLEMLYGEDYESILSEYEAENGYEETVQKIIDDMSELAA